MKNLFISFIFIFSASLPSSEEQIKDSIKNNKLLKLKDDPFEQLNNTNYLSNVESVDKLIKDNKLSNINLITANGIIDYNKNSIDKKE